MSATPDRLAKVQERLKQFVAERQWAQFHDPKNLAMAVASETGELVAELRWVSSDNADDFAAIPEHRIKLEHEAADVAIALLLFCDRIGVDLLSAIDRKIDINAANYPVQLSAGTAERPQVRRS